MTPTAAQGADAEHDPEDYAKHDPRTKTAPPMMAGPSSRPSVLHPRGLLPCARPCDQTSFWEKSDMFFYDQAVE